MYNGGEDPCYDFYMKKILAVVVVVIFFAIILLAVLAKLFSTDDRTEAVPAEVTFPVSEAVGSTNNQPDAFVTAFYAWYLSNAARDPQFPRPENRDEVLADWLSSSFIADWDQTHAVSEASPILLTANDTSDWNPAVRSRVIDQLAYTSTVQVDISSPTSNPSFIVQLVRTRDGQWKIDAILNNL